MKNRIEKQIELMAPRSKVWQALTDEKQFGEWFRVKLEKPIVLGGTMRGRITYEGYEHIPFEAHVEKLEHERLFAFTWPHVDMATGERYALDSVTLVEFRLEPIEKGTRLTITESGFEKLPADKRADAFKGNEEGWGTQVENIKAYLLGRD